MTIKWLIGWHGRQEREALQRMAAAGNKSERLLNRVTVQAHHETVLHLAHLLDLLSQDRSEDEEMTLPNARHYHKVPTDDWLGTLGGGCTQAMSRRRRLFSV